MSSDSHQCSDACRKKLPLVTFHNLWSLFISITVAQMLSLAPYGSVSRARIGRQLIVSSIAFANIALDRSLLVGTTLKSIPFVRPIGNVLIIRQLHTSEPVWRPTVSYQSGLFLCLLSFTIWCRMDRFTLRSLNFAQTEFVVWTLIQLLSAASESLLELFNCNSHVLPFNPSLNDLSPTLSNQVEKIGVESVFQRTEIDLVSSLFSSHFTRTFDWASVPPIPRKRLLPYNFVRGNMG